MNDCTFRELGLSEELLTALDNKGYGYPTKVQQEAIPPLLEWKDVIAKAPTGTGKTYAFGIPMISHIDPADDNLQGLILAPTRELAIQICDELHGLLKFYKNIRVAVVYGGQKIDVQIKKLKQKPQIIVATPGRLMDHYNRHTVRFDRIKTVILDEADRMLDMGFFKDVTHILDKVKKCGAMKNLGLFSATLSQEVMTVSWMYQRDEVEITVKPEAESKPDIAQYSVTVPSLEKSLAVQKLLRLEQYDRVMIFCNTKVMCQRLCEDLQRAGIRAEALHGNIAQNQRERTMQTFRKGMLPVLVATDVASRGIDVDDVDCVINYDVPEENEYYIHRIGRTGRARKKGVSYTVLGNFPEAAKLGEIAKYSHFEIQPLVFTENGLAPAEKKTPPAPVARRRR